MNKIKELYLLLMALCMMLATSQATCIYVDDVSTILLRTDSLTDENGQRPIMPISVVSSGGGTIDVSPMPLKAKQSSSLSIWGELVSILLVVTLILMICVLMKKHTNQASVTYSITIRDSKACRKIELNSKQLSKPCFLGRSSNNHIQIKQEKVSLQHISMRLLGEELLIQDLSSSNGTQLNNKKLIAHQDYVVNVGDVITLGHGATLVIESHSRTTCKSGKKQNSSFILEGSLGQGQVVSYPLDSQLLSRANGLSVGRSSQSDIVITEPTISRSHFCLYYQSQTLFLEQMSDHNPCRINGQICLKNHRNRLALGDEITLAACRFKLAINRKK